MVFIVANKQKRRTKSRENTTAYPEVFFGSKNSQMLVSGRMGCKHLISCFKKRIPPLASTSTTIERVQRKGHSAKENYDYP